MINRQKSYYSSYIDNLLSEEAINRVKQKVLDNYYRYGTVTNLKGIPVSQVVSIYEK